MFVLIAPSWDWNGLPLVARHTSFTSVLIAPSWDWNVLGWNAVRQIIDRLNRTKLGLKRSFFNIDGMISYAVLIAPSWDWNETQRSTEHGRRAGLNRTKLGLKLRFWSGLPKQVGKCVLIAPSWDWNSAKARQFKRGKNQVLIAPSWDWNALHGHRFLNSDMACLNRTKLGLKLVFQCHVCQLYDS